MKKKEVKNKHGFTLIELLVVVLIIGILSSIALPMYRKAVEKSRVADALSTMDAVAKSEHGWYLTNNDYTKDFSDLDIDLTDADGNKADNASFANALYSYELLDTGIIAERNNGEYTLYKDYDSQQILCTPGTHYICEELGAFTKVPCEKVGMAWANSNSTCYVDNEARCKGLYDDSMWNTTRKLCGYYGTNSQEINEGMECRASGENCKYSIINNGGICTTPLTQTGGVTGACAYSTINTGGKCIATSNIISNASGVCANSLINGGECIGEGSRYACNGSTITAGGICSGKGLDACNGTTVYEGECKANCYGAIVYSSGVCSGGCQNATIYGGECSGTCRDAKIYDGGECSGACYQAQINDGSTCTGDCRAARINEGSKCISSPTNWCGKNSISYYNGTGCCEGDYCGTAPKCNCPINESTGKHLTSC